VLRKQINAVFNKALGASDLRERFLRLGLEPAGGIAADLQAIMKRDSDRWGPVVKASGLRAE
jgi:tripartite-type tricarboxylate transporter receptor subunit TctC